MERQIEGSNYRVLVVGDSVVAVSERLPAAVEGDGVHSVKELIEMENSDPLRGDGHEKPLTKIKVDDHVMFTLGKQGLDLNYIPRRGETVTLRENCNLSTGGKAVDRTDRIHPQVSMMAVRAAGIIGLDVAGVDITTTDISKPLKSTGGAIIEVNAAPGIRMHHYPSRQARNAAGHSGHALSRAAVLHTDSIDNGYQWKDNHSQAAVLHIVHKRVQCGLYHHRRDIYKP